MWLRYKHRFSYGTDSDWSYRYIGEDVDQMLASEKKSTIELALKHLPPSEDYSYSEHYRGVTTELVDHAPIDILRKERGNAMARIASLQSFVQRLDAEIKEVSPPEPAPKLKFTGKKARAIDPEFVAKALGAVHLSENDPLVKRLRRISGRVNRKIT